VHSAALVAEHWPHAPEAWHAGVEPPQSLSPAQPRQAWTVWSHLGADSGQSASARQPTQVPADTRHRGCVPVQRLVLPAEHSPHAPLVWQAGVAPPHSLSPAHARHTWAATLHTGVVPPHSALVLQLAQVPVATLQAGVVPVQRVTLVAEQTLQLPLVWQAGVAPPPQSLSPAQARHVWVVPSQTGVAPEQSALARHATQLPAGV
jgi:hypothetical protein